MHIYQVWEARDGDAVVRIIDTRERCKGRRFALRVNNARLVDEFVACSHKEAVAFWRRIEQSRRPRSSEVD